MLSMAVRRSCARLVSSRAGAFAWLALCWCWRRWLAVPGLCMAGGAGGPLPALRMGGRVCLAGALLVLAALAGGAWSLHGWRCWRPAACLAHGRARLLGSLALVLALFIGWRLRPAPGRYAPPPVSYPSRHTRPTPPRLAPAPARACPSCRRAPAPPSPDGPPKTATARRRGYLPRPVSSPGKLC